MTQMSIIVQDLNNNNNKAGIDLANSGKIVSAHFQSAPYKLDMPEIVTKISNRINDLPHFVISIDNFRHK